MATTTIFGKKFGPKPGSKPVDPAATSLWNSACEQLGAEATHVQEWFNTLHKDKQDKGPTNDADDILGNISNIGNCQNFDKDIAQQACTSIENTYRNKKTDWLAKTRAAAGYGQAAATALETKLRERIEPRIADLRTAVDGMN